MHTKWMRGGLFVLALVAVLGLALVACHKKEGAEQSSVVAAPAAQAPEQVAPVAAAPVASAPKVAASPRPVLAVGKVPPPAGHREGLIERKPLVAIEPERSAMTLAAGALPDGDSKAAPTAARGPQEPTVIDLPPVVGDTVTVADLPAGEPLQTPQMETNSGEEEFAEARGKRYEGIHVEQWQDAADPSQTPPSTLVPMGAPAVDESGPSPDAAPPVNQGTGFKDYIAQAGSGPPDTDLAVGTSYIITDYNSYFKIWDKATSPPTLKSTTNFSTFFSGGTTTNCGNAANNICDPQMVYDDQNNRFVFTCLAVTASQAYICVAASQTADPRGTWNKYELQPYSGYLPDYPHTAIGEDAIFVGSNNFTWPAGAFYQSAILAINKANLYAGAALTTRVSTLGANPYNPRPVVRRGYNQGQYPPAGTPHYFMVGDASDNATVWSWPQPTFSSNPAQVGSWSLAYPGNATNPNNPAYTNLGIDALAYKIMDAEIRWPKIWFVRTGLATNDVINWAEVNMTTGTPVTVQSGNLGQTNAQLWMPDCTIDKNNSMAMVFTMAGVTPTILVGSYMTGHDSAGTPTGTGLMEAIQTSKVGEVVYTGVQNTAGTAYRWGDYLGCQIDPNGCDIWVNGMYSATSGTTNKEATWVQQWRFADCVAGATRLASLDKGFYYCVDSISATITDTAGAPTNAVYHCSGGATVPGVISGTGPTYTVTPTTIAALSGVDTNTVWLSFTGSDAASYSSPTALIDCTSKVCVYRVDPITGGCDNDEYPDLGEVVNVNVALANYESYNLPGPMQADLQLVGSDPNLTIVNGTAVFPALDSMTYAYSETPFAIKYTGALTNCKVPLNFQVVNIRAVDNAWASSGCTAGSNLFSTAANEDDSLGTALLTESFDGTTYPPTNWSQTQVAGTGLTARVTAGTTPTCAPHSGVGMVKYDSYNYAAGTAARLVTPSQNLSAQSKVSASFWMYHSGTYTNADTIAIQASDNGTTWTTLATFTRNVPSTLGWLQHSTALTGFVGAGHTTVRVGFLFTSAYGLNLFFDDVTVNPTVQNCETATCTPAPVLAYDQYAFADAGCNANGYLDPGEVGVLSLYLANTGNDWAYGTTATLTCPTCPANWGTICDNTAIYGSIPYGTTYVYAPVTDTFSVAINPALACGAANAPVELPFVVTVNATNPYGPVALNAPVLLGGPKIFTPTANNHTYEEHFTLDPGTAGAGGRGGFTTAWTESTATRITSATRTSVCTDTDGDGKVASVDRAESFSHLFSTVGIDYDLLISWEWDVGMQPTSTAGGLFLEYTVDGSTWATVVSSPGTNTTTGDWECWSGSMYASVDASQQCYGAGCVLGNPNFGIRFRVGTNGGNTPDGYFDNLIFDGLNIQCTSTTCTGTCPSSGGPPAVPADSSVTGTPLRLVKNGSNVDVTWDSSCTGATDYRLLWGNISSLSLASNVTNGTATSATCSLGLTGNAANVSSPNPTAGQCFFCVIDSVSGTEFGRHGNNSFGNEILLSGDTTFCGVTTKNITKTTCGAGFAQEAATFSSEPPAMKPAGDVRRAFHKCGETATQPPIRGGKLPTETRVE